MAYNEHLGDRVHTILQNKKVEYIAKKMMGGLCFMVDDKMCCGVVRNDLMARIGTDTYSLALEKSGVSEMNFTGRSMKGFVYVTPEATDMEDDLEYWIQLCLDFNPLAKSSKKKKKKVS